MAKKNGNGHDESPPNVNLLGLLGLIEALSTLTVNGKQVPVSKEEAMLATKSFEALSAGEYGDNGCESLQTLKQQFMELDPDTLDTVVVLTLRKPLKDEFCESCQETHTAGDGIVNNIQMLGNRHAMRLMFTIALQSLSEDERPVSIDQLFRDFMREREEQSRDERSNDS